MSRATSVAGSCCWPGPSRNPQEDKLIRALWDHLGRLKLVANWVPVTSIQESNMIEGSKIGSFMVDSQNDQKSSEILPEIS